MEPRSELRGQLARASAALIASFALVAACVGDDPDASSSSSSSSTSSSGGSDASSSGASSSGNTSSSGTPGDDAGDAAAKKCDPDTPFANIGEIPFATTVTGKAARLTPDEQTIYFHVVAPGRLKVATKVGPMFGAPSDVLGVGPAVDAGFPYDDAYPSIGVSDKVLFFGSTRAQNNVNITRIHTATRSATGVGTPFTNPVAVSTLPDDTNGPYALGDGEVMYFWRDTGTVNKSFRATLTGASYGTPVEVELGGGSEFPVVTPDEHVIYFATNRGGNGGVEIYFAVRAGAAPGSPFGTPKKVDAVNEAGKANIPSWISADYCRLYFFRNEDQKLLVASRTPPP